MKIMKIKNLFKKNYAARIAGALATFASIKEDLMNANTEQVSKNTSRINKLNSKNETLATSKEANKNIIDSVSAIIKKGTL